MPSPQLLQRYLPLASSAGTLAATVFIHELGHFTAALNRRVHVNKLSIGFGPIVTSFQWRGIEVALRALPLGGYVGFPSDKELDPESEYEKDDPDLLNNRGPLDRAIVLSAGVAANILFAFSLLASQNVTNGHLLQQPIPGVSVQSVYASSSADAAGIRAGDRLLAVNGKALPSGHEGVATVMSVVRQSPEKRVVFDVLRSGSEDERRTEQLGVEPELDANGNGRAHMAVQASVSASRQRVSPTSAVTLAATDTFRVCSNVLQGLLSVFVKSDASQQMSSPVYIVKAGADMAKDNGLSALVQFCATINCNLAVINLLPLPALDGGYLAFVLLEVVRGGKKLERKLEQRIMASGLVLLASTSLLLVARDTFSIFSPGS